MQTKASASITPWTTIASGYTYEPFGAVDAIALGNGLSVANTWGLDGTLASRRLYRATGGTNLSYLTYGYDADGNIGSITDQMTPANTVNYGYDNVDRLSMVVSASTSATAQTYAYTKGTNRLATLTTSAGTRTVTYDGRGNTAKEVRPSAITATTTYDGYARLTGYTRTDVGAYTFTYNGLDDRVTMTNAANGTRTFVYDNQARVLGEYGASATDVKAEYIWALPSTGAGLFGGDDGVGGYAPLAVATPNSTGTIQLNWVFGNHLGVPLVTTDSTGALATTPNNYFLPGFPGQSRIIADLYYNRYRDYDPTTGRYIQADPIGLDGGSNPYAYVLANPINRVDPLGLASSPYPTRNPGGIPALPSLCNIMWCPGQNILGPMPPLNQMLYNKINDAGRECNRVACELEREVEMKWCEEKFAYKKSAYDNCRRRADTNFDLCMRGLPTLPYWKDVNEDGWQPPRPPRKKKRW